MVAKRKFKHTGGGHPLRVAEATLPPSQPKIEGMVRIPTKSYQRREIKSRQEGTQRLLRRDGWIALQAEER